MSDYILKHHGIKGQKWGVRRFQNPDGSLTSKGKNRYLRAADKGDRDAADLRKHGYHAEADAVQKVADKNRQKGMRRINKKYDKEIDKAVAGIKSKEQKRQVDAYNTAADKMNSGGIAEYNASQRKKYGENYTKREGYIEDYEKMFAAEVGKEYYKRLLADVQHDEHYKKAQKLVDKYGSENFNHAADNAKVIEELIGKNK